MKFWIGVLACSAFFTGIGMHVFYNITFGEVDHYVEQQREAVGLIENYRKSEKLFPYIKRHSYSRHIRHRPSFEGVKCDKQYQFLYGSWDVNDFISHVDTDMLGRTWCVYAHKSFNFERFIHGKRYRV